jgi:hypothetical protein
LKKIHLISNEGSNIIRNLIVIVISVILFSYCTNIIDNNVRDKTKNTISKTIYQNDFENANDLFGWIGLSDANLSNDFYSGKSSLILSGGCIQPVTKYEFTLQEEGDYSISCFGKTVEDNQTCRLVLSRNIDSETSYVAVEIKGNNWKFYESTNIHFQKGEKAMLYLNLGGIIAATSYIDNLKISKME